MIRTNITIIILIFLISFHNDNYTLAQKIEYNLFPETNHTVNRNVINYCPSSHDTLKWFIRAFDDSSETPCFGWASSGFALVLTNQKMYLYNHESVSWKTIKYRTPHEIFINGISNMDYCLFWTDKNIYIFTNQSDSLIIKSYVDINEIPYKG